MRQESRKSPIFTYSFFLFVLYTLYVAQSFFIPLTLAIFLRFLLMPFVRMLRRIHLPYELAALIVIVILAGITGLGVSVLAKPAQEWFSSLPSAIHQLQRSLSEWRLPVQSVSKTAESVRDFTNILPSTVPEVTIKSPSILENLMNGSQSFIYSTVVILTLLYGMLAYGDKFLRNLADILPSNTTREGTLQIARELEGSFSIYLVTIATINTCLGAIQALAMYFLGMDAPLLWGALVGILNFIPFIGPAIAVGLIGLGAVLSFKTISSMLLPPLVATLIIAIESILVTPYILSKRFSVNLVAMILWIIFWGWMWGIAGSLMAVPMLTAIKLLSDNIQSLKPVATLLK